MLKAVATAVVLLVAGPAGGEQESGIRPVPGHPQLLLIEGEIQRGASAQFAVALKTSPEATTVVLNSGGGNVGEALIIADTIRSRGMDTLVLPDLFCNSACVFAFAGGVNRAALGDIGVHQIAGGNDDMSSVQHDLSAIARVLSEAGIAAGLLYKMLSTPHEEVYYLSQEEIRDFGLNAGHVKWLDNTTLSAP